MRIPLATSLKTRTGAPDKDARLTNAYVEVKGEQSVVRKRTGVDTALTSTVGTAQGGIATVVNGVDVVVAVNGDTVNIVAAITNIPTSTELLTSAALYNSAIGVTPQNWVLQIENCALVDIPPDNNLGTSVYDGPSATPLNLPSNTVEYVTIAESNCGLYRKVITKTYAARSSSGYQVIGTSGTGVEYFNDIGTDADAVCTLAWAAYRSYAGSPPLVTPVAKVGVQCTLTDYGSTFGSIVTPIGAIYYIDVTESWHYEIV